MEKSALESKREIRQAVKSLLKSLPPEANAEKSARITEKALSDPALKNAERILIYRAMPEEVQTQDIIEGLRKTGHQVFVPVVIPGEADLAVVRWREPETGWVAGPFGIMQPKVEGAEILDAEKLDLVFAPGLAFDTAGGRLGHGKGYFDRLFHKTGIHCRRTGLAFDIQVVPEVPMGPGDVPLNGIITETRTIQCPPHGGH